MCARILFACCLTLLWGCSAASSDEPTPDAATEDTSVRRPGLDAGTARDTGTSDVPVPDTGTVEDAGADAGSDTDTDTPDAAPADVAPETVDDAGPCVDECAAEGRTTCDDMGRLADCVRDTTTGCLTVQSPRGCGQGFICEGGLCVDDGSCDDECPTAGVITCTLDGSGFQSCIDIDDDGCLELSEPAFCSDGQVCNDGFCTNDCTDICESAGSTICDEGGNVVMCDDYNFDGCLEYGDPTACGAGEVCDDGTCEEFTAPAECLLISEYQEGSSFNKAVEIVNCGSEPRSLAGHAIFTVFNSGATTGQHSLSGTLAPGEVRVYCHGDHAAASSLCDETSNSAINWNGNDRFVLFRDVNTNNEYDAGTDELLDAWGQLDTDPGSEWQDVVYRRTTCEPYLQVGGFDVASRYTSADADDTSDLGTAPTLRCD